MKKYSIYEIDHMDGHAFEYFCAELLRKNGYKKVEVTPGSGDQGIDVIANKDGIRFGIQCKCYTSDIGNKAVQEAYSGKEFYGCHIGVVLSNRYFTASAKELASKNRILLWDREHLIDLLKKADLYAENSENEDSQDDAKINDNAANTETVINITYIPNPYTPIQENGKKYDVILSEVDKGILRNAGRRNLALQTITSCAKISYGEALTALSHNPAKVAVNLSKDEAERLARSFCIIGCKFDVRETEPNTEPVLSTRDKRYEKAKKEYKQHLYLTIALVVAFIAFLGVIIFFLQNNVSPPVVLILVEILYFIMAIGFFNSYKEKSALIKEYENQSK